MIRLSGDAIAKIVAGQDRPALGPSALTLGAFDGLHLGHQELIRRTRDARRRLGLADAAMFTFVQSPRHVLHPDNRPWQLTTWRAKLGALQALDCGTLVAADFTPAVARVDYRTFVERILVGHLGMKHFVVGHDVHLGAGRGGNATTLEALSAELGFGLEVCPPVELDGRIISSSAIRAAVTAGEVTLAGRMLGRPYSLWGVVEPGDSRGHALGYPTANVAPLEATKLLPATGVYAVRVHVPGDLAPVGTPGVIGRVDSALPEVDRDGVLVGMAPADWAVFGGMLNFGYVPTFHGSGLPQPRIEAHLFDFHGELQGRTVMVEWLARLRSEQRFDGVHALVAQLGRDAAGARQVLDQTPRP
ncbi:MAG TPA: bifunctional riboflavin kinase/FMN adenylyltransferase [Candidatus Krumholzibacteria bacterium]|nr:bifunctional riboflavin kinase/FMN adenylyltransferase [Candidatus Krumholzibacteria bacterium]